MALRTSGLRSKASASAAKIADLAVLSSACARLNSASSAVFIASMLAWPTDFGTASRFRRIASTSLAASTSSLIIDAKASLRNFLSLRSASLTADSLSLSMASSSASCAL